MLPLIMAIVIKSATDKKKLVDWEARRPPQEHGYSESQWHDRRAAWVSEKNDTWKVWDRRGNSWMDMATYDRSQCDNTSYALLFYGADTLE